MRKLMLILLFINIIFVSCSSLKMEDKVILNYISDEYGSKYDTLFISEYQLPYSQIISLYAQAYESKDIKGIKPVYFYPDSVDWPLNEKDVKLLKEKYNVRNEKSWKKEDFPFNAVIVPKDYFKYTIPVINNNKLLYLSKPVYSRKKGVIIFEFSLSNAAMSSSPLENGILVMVKQNGKWRKEITLWTEVYY